MVETETKGGELSGRSPRRLYFLFALVFAAAFGLAFVLAWYLYSPQAERVEPPPTITSADLQGFFEKVDTGDFPGMKDAGGRLFKEGALLPDSRRELAAFETTSYDPYIVYAFYSLTDSDKTRRVLLTMDSQDRVISFLAEEMTIAK